jgi:hypothetical protein
MMFSTKHLNASMHHFSNLILCSAVNIMPNIFPEQFDMPTYANRLLPRFAGRFLLLSSADEFGIPVHFLFKHTVFACHISVHACC